MAYFIAINFFPSFIFTDSFSNIGQNVNSIVTFSLIPLKPIVIILYLCYLVFIFCVAGFISKKDPSAMLENQVSGYLTALGTQFLEATITLNLICAEKNRVSKEIREFVIPLFANTHMAGSMITIIFCVTSVLLITNMPIIIGIIFPFILTLGVTMVASYGAIGSCIMTTLSFIPLVKIASEGELSRLLITRYLTQDSFGIACNISGDNEIAVIVDSSYKKFIAKEKK